MVSAPGPWRETYTRWLQPSCPIRHDCCPLSTPGSAAPSAAPRRCLDQRHEVRIYRPQGWVSPALLVNGQMVGVWRHARRGRRLLVEIEPFGTLPSWAAAQVEAEAERLAAFLGGTLELSYLSL